MRRREGCATRKQATGETSAIGIPSDLQVGPYDLRNRSLACALLCGVPWRPRAHVEQRVERTEARGSRHQEDSGDDASDPQPCSSKIREHQDNKRDTNDSAERSVETALVLSKHLNRSFMLVRAHTPASLMECASAEKVTTILETCASRPTTDGCYTSGKWLSLDTIGSGALWRFPMRAIC